MKHLEFKPCLLIVLSSFFFSLLFAQNCEIKQFIKTYTFPGFSQSSFMDTTLSGGFMWGGGENRKLTLNKSDINGDLIWSKKYNISNPSSSCEKFNMVQDKNNNYFVNFGVDVCGLINQNGDTTAIKKLRNLVVNPRIEIFSLYVLPNNNKVILAQDESFYGVEGYAIICLSPDLSNVIWQKHISAWSLFSPSLCISNNSIAFLALDYEQPVVVKLNHSGNLISVKSYRYSTIATYPFKIKAIEDGYLVTAFAQLNFDRKYFIIRLNSNLDIVKTTEILSINNNSVNTNNIDILVKEDKSYYVYFSIGFLQHIISYNNNDSALWAKKNLGFTLTTTPISSLRETKYGLVGGGNSSYNAVGTGAFADFTLWRSDGNAKFENCYTDIFSFLNTPMTLNTLNSNVNIRDTNLFFIEPSSLTISSNSMPIYNNCSYTNNCNQLDIVGPINSCTNVPISYIGRKNNSCKLPLTWKIIGASTTNQILNDSTISINFSQSGSYKIISTINDVCNSISDTIDVAITVISQTPTLNIGPRDTLLCEKNTILLTAQNGFNTYEWQDGSTNQTYLVNQAGTYHVKVTNACGGIFRDTIDVFNHPPINFSAGSDRLKCNNDTVHINTSNGFYNFIWTPNYNISSINSPNVIVNPYVDTTYYVSALKSQGCTVFDTVKVTVKNSPQINLGVDKYLCTGDTITLNVPNIFDSYLWNTGSILPQLKVFSGGMYSVIGRFANGCNSYDTIDISAKNKPVVNLNSTNTICIGTPKILDAGIFNSYLWEDGSILRQRNVSSLGIYYVTVTDNFGCKGSDTVKITKYGATPSNFLPLDSTKCSYNNITISPLQNYTSYMWNTNATTKEISIKQPGLYWLQVKDINDCIGKDSINIYTKDCLRGLYLPNAFTPNNDNKNDIFKPQIFGNLLYYEFYIFDRFGKQVFYSRDINKGWDGKYKGQEQKMGTYAWICKYQIAGQNINEEKGTLILLH